jgi:hypothetical protein
LLKSFPTISGPEASPISIALRRQDRARLELGPPRWGEVPNFPVPSPPPIIPPGLVNPLNALSGGVAQLTGIVIDPVTEVPRGGPLPSPPPIVPPWILQLLVDRTRLPSAAEVSGFAVRIDFATLQEDAPQSQPTTLLFAHLNATGGAVDLSVANQHHLQSGTVLQVSVWARTHADAYEPFGQFNIKASEAADESSQ